MDLRERLNLSVQAATFDDWQAAEDGSPDARGLFSLPFDEAPIDNRVLPCVSHHTTPGGRREAVLKVLQTSSCQNNCNYCAFRASRDTRRVHITPDEMARSFDLMHRAGLVEGMFLSSGVIGTNRSMDEMIATGEQVRYKYGFHGYLHMKVLPGAEAGQVERAVQLADRVSVNLEGPTRQHLAVLAPNKSMADLLSPLRTAALLVRRSKQLGPSRDQAAEIADYRASSKPAARPWGNAWLGLSTQFVVGPAGESDSELLSTAQMLYKDLHLSRVYYSAFTPVAHTPFENEPATHSQREHRLYQADWLLRFYGFSAGELLFNPDGQLLAGVDPKAAWARAHPESFPIEVNRAPYSQLLRIPGIGPHSARIIITARRVAPLREIGDLRRLGARADQAAPYVLIDGKRPPHQLCLPLQHLGR